MELTSSAFSDGSPIPDEYAFCNPDPDAHVTLGANRNPDLAWSGAPAGTRSFALVCVDGDVPSKPDDVNQEGREIPADLPRINFYHWLVADLPAEVTSIAAGEFSDGVVARGKPDATGPHGCRQGVNDYTVWFGGDTDMEGQYYGYDGPCPPWNDTIVHHYRFTVYALDVERTPVEGAFTGQQLLDAIEGHVLDSASITGTYTLNPRLRS